MTTKEWIGTILKGVGMGAANDIPGVSGGTIAFITGIYERLVGAINNFDRQALKMLFTGRFREVWKHLDGEFLLALMIGVFIGAIGIAKLLLDFLHFYPVQTWAFFFGLIVASSILILRGIKEWKAIDFLWLIVGGAIGVGVCSLPTMHTSDSLWMIFLCGAISICAMILPGISGSFLLLVMGKWETIMMAMTGMILLDVRSIIIIITFALGCAVGILAFAKLLHALLDRWNRQTILVLAGFVLGSLVKVWPWNDAEALTRVGLPTEGFPLWGHAILFCIAGTVLVLGLEWLGKLMKNN